MPAQETSDRVAALLEGLNPPQRDAVTAGPGPLLILAGAGSGKTRVLTHRIAYLLRTGQARPDEILAITFTNKAAQEMRERVELLVGRATRAMWVMTFHSACARMLRADAHRLGYTRQFTIYDSADQRRLIKKCLDDLEIDPKRFTPRAMQVQISDAKNKLRAADDYRQMVGSFFEQTVADVYESYERELHRANAMDFDDLLFRAVNLLELFQEVRDRYTNAFRWILVDEYQDTNRAQYRWLQLLSSEHRNLAVVGDDDQCLVEGTLVTMADGSKRPIELVNEGEEVLSCYGSGDFRPARVHERLPLRAVGRRRDHDARRAADRQHSRARALRRLPAAGEPAAAHDVPAVAAGHGLSRRDDADVPGARGARPVSGVAQRAMQERADAPGCSGRTRQRRRLARRRRSCRSATSCRRCRSSRARRQRERARLRPGADRPRLRERRHLRARARSCCSTGSSYFDEPHHVPRTWEGRRRNVTVTLCGDRRGRTPMHTVAVGGRDPEAAAALAPASG